MGAFNAYPSHRFHPSLERNSDGTAESVIVADQDEDDRLEATDSLWRDSPYTEEDHDEWRAKNPKGKKARKPLPGQTTAPVEEEPKPRGPRRENFSSKADWKTAVKKFEETQKTAVKKFEETQKKAAK